MRKVAKCVTEEDKTSPCGSMANVVDEDSVAPSTPLFSDEFEAKDVQVEDELETALEQAKDLQTEGDEDFLNSSSSSDSSTSSSESVNEEEMHVRINGDSYLKNTSEPVHQHAKPRCSIDLAKLMVLFCVEGGSMTTTCF